MLLKRTRRFLFPPRARDELYSTRAAPYRNAPSCPLSCVYTAGDLGLTLYYTDGLYTKRTRAHTHRALIREWLWDPKGDSLEYI